MALLGINVSAAGVVEPVAVVVLGQCVVVLNYSACPGFGLVAIGTGAVHVLVEGPVGEVRPADGDAQCSAAKPPPGKRRLIAACSWIAAELPLYALNVLLATGGIGLESDAGIMEYRNIRLKLLP